MAIRVVVTGASGMLGSAIVREAIAQRDPVAGWARSVPKTLDGIVFTQLDLAQDMVRVRTLLAGQKPNVIIHCAAATDADFCQENVATARAINSYVSGDLAQIAAQLKIRFIQISTDAVYDDSRPGLRKESEQPKPQSVYAKTKLEGEGRVLAAYPEALVIRTTMFGWTLPSAPRPKFAEQILAALTTRRQIKLFQDAYFSPLHVENLAEVILELAETDISGVLNVGAREPISKYEFGCTIADVFGLDPSFIEKSQVDDIPMKAKRTKNVGMNVKEVSKILGLMPTVEMGIRRLYQEAFDGTAKKIRGRETYP